MSTTSTDLLLVFSELGQLVSENEYNDWADNEHIPQRIQLPGFHSCVRLIQADQKEPVWGTIYDIDSLSVLQSEPYLNLFNSQSDREKVLLQNIALLDRRLYANNKQASIHVKDGFEGLQPGNVVVYVSFDITPEHEEELHRWYEEEHIDLLKKVPGWLQSRRYILHDAKVSGKNASQYSKAPPPKFMAAHYYESGHMQETKEWKEATSTPWRARVMELVGNTERRFFNVYKTFQLCGENVVAK